MAHVRTFLAINFPVAAVRRMADEARALSRVTSAEGFDVAWVPAANIHLTLKFFGSIPSESVEAIRGRLVRELPAHAPFDLESRGVGAFPDARRPRILWVGVKASPALAALQQEVERWMEDLGFPREERPFHPHLTLGRVKGRRRREKPAAPPPSLAAPPPEGGAAGEEATAPEAGEDEDVGLSAALAARENTLFGMARVAELVIYESRTLRSGAEYVALARVALGTSTASDNETARAK